MPKFRYLSLPAFTAVLALGVSSPNVQAQAPLHLGQIRAARRRHGRLTVVQEADPEHFKVVGDVVTEPCARTMAVDPATGDVFLVPARERSAGVPKHPGGPKSYKFVPGTVKLLIYRPTGTEL